VTLAISLPEADESPDRAAAGLFELRGFLVDTLRLDVDLVTEPVAGDGKGVGAVVGLVARVAGADVLKPAPFGAVGLGGALRADRGGIDRRRHHQTDQSQPRAAGADLGGLACAACFRRLNCPRDHGAP
jgi:hypothetical protein